MPGNGSLESGDRMRSSDLVSLAASLRAFPMDLVLLDEHGPRVDLQCLVQGEALLCSFDSGARFRGRFEIPHQLCLLGMVHDPGQRDSWCHGMSLVAGTALVVCAEGVSEFFIDKGARLTLVLMPVDRLREAINGQSLAGAMLAMPSLAPVVCSGRPESLRLLDLYQRLSHAVFSGETAPVAGILGEVVGAHVQVLLSAGSSSRPQFPRGRRGYYLMLQRAEAYMRLHMRRDLAMEEVCEAAGASERTLRYAFEHLLHISPKRYLSMLRLCAACHGLSMADASRRSVRSVALSCGLWDLSRFAESYRRVFGELPSETLMRVPPLSNGRGDG